MLSKLKQYKDMRDQGKKMQSALSGESTTTRAAGDRVVMTMNGNLEMTGLSISEELLKPEQKDRLQNAIKEAHGEALKKMQRTIAMKMQESGDFKLPGME